MCAELRAAFYQTEVLPLPSARPVFPKELFQDTTDSQSVKLEPETVWSIVTRWHAMKFLFQLYCDAGIRRGFENAILWQTPYSRNRRMDDFIEYEEPLPRPAGYECKTLNPLTHTRKMEAYCRFYRSLCSHWLHINVFWIAGICRYTNIAESEETFKNIKLAWNDRAERNFQEKIEAIEVYDFVWCFLARKIFKGPRDVRSWVNVVQLNEQFNSILWNLAGSTSYTGLVRLAVLYLRPTHITELLIDGWTQGTSGSSVSTASPSKPFLDKKVYLHQMGLFDWKFGVTYDDGVETIIFHWFTTDLLVTFEGWGIDRMMRRWGWGTCLDSGFCSSTYWQEFRARKWKIVFAGRSLLYPCSDEELVLRIRPSAQG